MRDTFVKDGAAIVLSLQALEVLSWNLEKNLRKEMTSLEYTFLFSSKMVSTW